MLRRGVGELAGEREAPEPSVTTNDTNLRRSFLTCHLMFVNLTGLRRDLKRVSRQCWWPFPINPQQSTHARRTSQSVGEINPPMSHHRVSAKNCPGFQHPNRNDLGIGYREFMSVLSITLTLLASLLIIGCASTEQHRHSLDDSHGFYPTPAYRVAQ